MLPITAAALVLSSLSPAQISDEEVKLVPSGTDSSDHVGSSVALFGDWCAVGAEQDETVQGPGLGAVHMYLRQGTSWTESAKLSRPDGGDFGTAVALSGDTLAVGSPHTEALGVAAGAVFVYRDIGGVWTLEDTLTPPVPDFDDWFGLCVALDGDTLVTGARFDDDSGLDAGAAYVFCRTGTAWSLQQKLVASDGADRDWFGFSVAADGDTLLVGAPRVDGGAEQDLGAVYVFDRSGTVWTEQQKLYAAGAFRDDWFGYSLAIEGDRAAIGSPFDNELMNDVGSVYVFERSAGSWSQSKRLNASDQGTGAELGTSVALQGDRILAGAPFARNWGAAYLFTKEDGTWREASRTKSSFRGVGGAPPEYGEAVALDGDRMVIGAYADREFGSRAGAAWAYTLTDVPHESFCFGNGGDNAGCTDCPCGNDAKREARGGCLNSEGFSCVLVARGVASVAADTLQFDVHGTTLSSFGVLISADNRLPNGITSSCPLGSGIVSVGSPLDGLRCIGGSAKRHGGRALDSQGFNESPWGGPGAPAAGLIAQAGFVAGQVRHFQLFYRESDTTQCLTGLNTSNAVSVIVLP